jgi:hypothetical protein
MIAHRDPRGSRDLPDTRGPGGINSASDWLRLLLGLGVVFGVFQWSAVALASNRGEAGLLVGVLVVGATLAAERLLFGGLARAGPLRASRCG